MCVTVLSSPGCVFGHFHPVLFPEENDARYTINPLLTFIQLLLLVLGIKSLSLCQSGADKRIKEKKRKKTI